MFATLLLFCNPEKPSDLWNRFRVSICDDLEYQLRRLGRANISEDDVYDYGLFLLDSI
ncbi:hypothetical protein F5880DRAFT_1451866, partial [Lentinula raphanica]